MSTINVCLTLSNPETFSTVEELRTELHRANANLLEAVQQTHNLAVRHNHVLKWITVVATHHELGNHDQVILCLDNVVKKKNQKMQTH